MDFIILGIGFGFFVLSWGLTRFCERLQDNGGK
jgi:hypothetical protein